MIAHYLLVFILNPYFICRSCCSTEAGLGDELYDGSQGDNLLKPEIPSDGKNFYKEHIRLSKPALFRKGAIHWPAVRLWRDKSYVESSFSDEKIKVNFYQDNRKITDILNFHELLVKCSASQAYCTSEVSFNSSIINDIYLPPFLQCKDIHVNAPEVLLVADYESKGSRLKEADNDIVLIVISGQKNVTLYGREFIIKLLQDSSALLTDPLTIDIGMVNDRYSELLKDFTFNVTLKPGDILYIPQLWWYHIETLIKKINIDVHIKLGLFQFSHEIEKKGISKKDSLKFYKQFHALREEQKNEISCLEKSLSLKSALNVSANDSETLHLRIPRKRERPEDVLLASGYRLPPIGFGTGLLFENTTTAVKHALDNGFRLIDAAQAYGEKGVAEAMREKGIPREEVFLITKLHPRFLGYQTTLDSIKQSLETLETDYIDVFLIHSKDCDDFLLKCNENEPNGTWQDSWKAMEEAHERGWIRSLGVSNFEVPDMEELVELAKVPVSVLQNWFDPLHQDVAVRKFCKSHNISYQGFSTLGSQWIHQLGLSYNPVLSSELIVGIASHYDYVASHVVLRYAIHKGVTPITSSANPNHIAQNFRSLDISLHSSEIDAIDEFDDAFVTALKDLDENMGSKEEESSGSDDDALTSEDKEIDKDQQDTEGSGEGISEQGTSDEVSDDVTDQESSSEKGSEERNSGNSQKSVDGSESTRTSTRETERLVKNEL